jgi:uncharacterized membrane protein YeaQ/YmgE (transglycosylase-associated protein family)
MSIIAWILLGIVVAVVFNQLGGRRGVGLVSDALVGIGGAAVLGFSFNVLAGTAGGLSAWGLLVSLVGAGVALALAGAIADRAAPVPVRVRRTRKTRR